jgi:hypothetical protein
MCDAHWTARQATTAEYSASIRASCARDVNPDHCLADNPDAVDPPSADSSARNRAAPSSTSTARG